MTIKLSELKAVRAGMRPGKWSPGESGNANLVSFDGDDVVGIARVGNPNYIAGISATHNAADVLIEVAQTALALVSAKKRAAAAHFAWARSVDADGSDSDGSDSDARLDAVDDTSRRVTAAQSAYDAALAKVMP